MGCSNGNAAGNNLEEAVLQGFFELVERDAVALWWYNRLRRSGVAVESFSEPYLLELVQHYRQHYQRVTWALDLTSDLGIPVFVAVSKMMEGKEERLLFGMGCHLDARIALQRAFAEMNQMLSMAHTGQDGTFSLEDRKRWNGCAMPHSPISPILQQTRISRSSVLAITRCSTAVNF